MRKLVDRIGVFLLPKSSFADFLPPARALIIRRPNPIVWIPIGICLSFIIVVIVVGLVGHVDIYAEGVGRIQPSGRSKVVQASEIGTVLDIFVHNGEFVSEGEKLFSLDAIDASATLRENEENRDVLRAEIARLEFENKLVVDGRIDARYIPKFPSDIPEAVVAQQRISFISDIHNLKVGMDEFASRATESRAKEISSREQLGDEQRTAALLRDKLAIRTSLASEGWDSKMDLLDAQKDYQKQLSSVDDLRGSIRSYSEAIKTNYLSREGVRRKFVVDNNSRIVDDYMKLSNAAEDTVKAGNSVSKTIIRSPITGFAQQLAVTTMGQVVNPGEQLLTIVPNRGGVEVQAEIRSEDIAYVKVGQPVEVKVRAFPFTQYGILHGNVVSVARDSVEISDANSEFGSRIVNLQASTSSASGVSPVQNLVYPVTIRLESDYLISPSGRERISAGMVVDIAISTGRRSIMEYFLSPLIQGLRSAGHER